VYLFSRSLHEGHRPPLRRGPSCHLSHGMLILSAYLQEAEEAARKLHDALIIHGTRCKLLWGKPQASPGTAGAGPGPGSGAAATAANQGPVDYFGMPQQPAYPSMDPQLMGSGPARPPPGMPPPGGLLPQPGMMPPLGMMQPPGMVGGGMPHMNMMPMMPPPGMRPPPGPAPPGTAP
jgi:hypothetical protein